MPITYQIDRTAALIRTRCSGDVSLDEVRNHFQALASDPDRPDRLDVFLDLREVTSSPSAEDIRKAGEIVASLPKTVRFGACAIVAQRDALYGMSRMFSVFVERFFSDIRTFRSALEADAWLQKQRGGVTDAAPPRGNSEH
jgi:hypothetical protein